MILRIVFECLFSLMLGYMSFVATNSIYFLIAVSIAFIIFFVSIELTYKRKLLLRDVRNKDLHLFIHDFIINFCQNITIDRAVNESLSNISLYLKEEINSLKEYKGIKKLESLSRYFNSQFYQLFIKTLSTYERGDSYDNFYYLFNENNRLLKALESDKKKTVKSMFEYAFTWIIAFIVLGIMRFAVNNFISSLSKNVIYLMGIAVFFLFFMLSTYLFIFTSNRSKNIYEQN